MKYRIKNLRLEGSVWKCTVEMWESCVCEMESVDVELKQKRMPLKKDILKQIKP